MKRALRPWENEGTVLSRQLVKSVLEPPSVTVDGIKYFSDRFYLNGVEELPGDQIWPTECQCGSKNPPPLLNRERLINSLSLKAVILGTYRADLDWLSQVFPQLVGETAKVPTLLLHGDAKIARLLEEEANPSTLPESEDTKHSEHNISEPFPCDRVPAYSGADANVTIPEDDASTVGSASLLTQEPCVTGDITATCLSFMQNEELSKTQQPTSANEVPSSKRSCRGENFQCVRVLSNWNPVTHSKVSIEGTESPKGPKRNETKRGVHHPKFMILVETTGDIVVVVTTANLTSTSTVEGTWLQRFRRRQTKTPQKPKIGNIKGFVQNDFGVVLQDFLERLSASSAADGASTVQSFCSKFMGFALEELAQWFHFEKAQVHLVPVVPGNWEDKPNKHKQSCLYGRQRVQHILRSIDNLLANKNDRLVSQPTSFGGNWKRSELADVVRSYMDVQPSDASFWDEEGLLERLDVIWPSRSFMHAAGSTEQGGENGTQTPKADSSFVFLSSDTFNSCERACLSRMSKFLASNPLQHPRVMVPHFKSMCRVVRQRAQVNSLAKNGSADDYLSWFLLTSACLSQGAQGKRSRTGQNAQSPSTKPGRVKYANFELGVLFTSRLGSRNKRVYCFRPQQCLCSSSLWNHELVHLPIPYILNPPSYLEHEEDMVMQEPPYFHEINEGTRSVGNMQMTGYPLSDMKP